MKPETILALATADEYQRLAVRLVTDDATPDDLVRWAVVIAFCSAIHYINAFLEEHWIAPANHHERDRAMQMHRSVFSPAMQSYLSLKNDAWSVRYTPGFRIARSRITSRATRDLEVVHTSVLSNI